MGKRGRNSLHGMRSKGKGKGVWAQDHASRVPKSPFQMPDEILLSPPSIHPLFLLYFVKLRYEKLSLFLQRLNFKISIERKAMKKCGLARVS